MKNIKKIIILLMSLHAFNAIDAKIEFRVVEINNLSPKPLFVYNNEELIAYIKPGQTYDKPFIIQTFNKHSKIYNHPDEISNRKSNVRIETEDQQQHFFLLTDRTVRIASPTKTPRPNTIESDIYLLEHPQERTLNHITQGKTFWEGSFKENGEEIYNIRLTFVSNPSATISGHIHVDLIQQ